MLDLFLGAALAAFMLLAVYGASWKALEFLGGVMPSLKKILLRLAFGAPVTLLILALYVWFSR